MDTRLVSSHEYIVREQLVGFSPGAERVFSPVDAPEVWGSGKFMWSTAVAKLAPPLGLI